VDSALAHHTALLRDFSDLLAQLRGHEPADFGRVARRSSEPAERLLELLWLEREDLLHLATAPKSDDLVAQCVRDWLDWSYDNNQFFEFEPTQLESLRRAHSLLFRVVHSNLHAQTDAEFVRRCQLAYVRYAERLSRIFRPLATSEGLRGRGAEYSPELQLRILGLDEHEWLEPVVDLGCGVDAKLVQHLRNRGLDAVGIERRGRLPILLAKDWFDVRFEPGSIGTLLSHQAFSLQFLHHHWHPGDRAFAYAQKYMELLRSLIPGGIFCYAPGLPFIECLLDPEKFEVTSSPLPEPLASTMASLRDIGTGQSVAYTCRIRRVSTPL
jgi:hypothetical protein